MRDSKYQGRDEWPFGYMAADAAQRDAWLAALEFCLTALARTPAGRHGGYQAVVASMGDEWRATLAGTQMPLHDETYLAGVWQGVQAFADRLWEEAESEAGRDGEWTEELETLPL